MASQSFKTFRVSDAQLVKRLGEIASAMASQDRFSSPTVRGNIGTGGGAVFHDRPWE
jgi:hypothetical protein